MKNRCFDLLSIIAGNLLLSAGIAFLLVPHSILTGGVAGIAIIIEPFVALDESMLITIMTVALFFVGLLFLGKNFALKTLLSSLLYPFFVALFTNFESSIYVTDNALLASFYGGILVGCGVGLVFRVGGSTGGMDIPPLVIHKYTGIPLSKLVLLTDACVVMLGLFVYGIEPVLIGLISIFTSNYMLDKMLMLGMSASKSVMIISDRYEAMIQEISNRLGRGATIIHAQGSYRKDPRPILMVVVLNKQFPELNRIINGIDPGAFIIVHDVNEVRGEGFTFNEEL